MVGMKERTYIVSFIIKIAQKAFKGYLNEFRYYIKAKLCVLVGDVTSDAQKILQIRKLSHRLERYLFDPGAYSKDSGKAFYDALTRFLSEKKEEDSSKTLDWARKITEEYTNKDGENVLCPMLTSGKKRILPRITPVELMELLKQRRSRRVFENNLLTEEERVKLSEAVQQAPSACNRQTLEVIFIEDPNLKELVSSTLKGGYQFFHKAPAIMIILSDARDNKYPEERMVPYMDTSAAVQNVYLMCEVMGLGCCWGNYGSFCGVEGEAKVRQALKIPATHLITASLAIGKSNQVICNIPRDDPRRRYGNDSFRGR